MKINNIMKARSIFGLVVALAAILTVAGCRPNRKTLLPNVSGKAGEVIIVMDKDNWEGDLGTEVRNVLGGDTPYLSQREPLFSLVNISPTGFADLFKVHRNIVFFNIAADTQKPGVVYRADIWARPQCVIQLAAADAASMLDIFKENSTTILNALEQAERDRIIANSKLYEETSIATEVKKMAGGSPHFPSGYRLRKATDNFMWISDDKQYTIQGVFVYKYPASENENFTEENIIAHRNEILEENVPGMFDNTWMTTSTFIKPTVEFIRYRGRQFAQTRGFWEVQNDFMGGPFVSHSFYSKDGKDIIVLDGWVYAPKYDKRQYLRQVEAILYSFEWEEQDEEAGEKAQEAGIDRG